MPARGSERQRVGTVYDQVWELEAPAVPESMDAVQDLVSRLYDETADDLSATDRIRFETALVEIVGNVIEHGRPCHDAEAITLRISLLRNDVDLIATITDDAEAASVDFDSATMSDLDDENGRGLAMARALATELRHERRGRLNEWTVRCRCAS